MEHDWEREREMGAVTKEEVAEDDRNIEALHETPCTWTTESWDGDTCKKMVLPIHVHER